ncbi:MAG: S46 family peptidase [Elusimicrobia bacterium]|nr:S46 family peptidase [Elusimicrobiota bacterium]
MKKLMLLAAALCLSPVVRADEGMWTVDNLPLQRLQERYQFTPAPEWLDKVRLASVRFNDGGSGAFVSPGGLVITNHHVALGQLQKMSSEKKDYVKDGFFARRPSEEQPCPDLELNVLVSTQDVTARVLAAIDAKASDAAQNSQRKAEISRIEKESFEKTKLRSDVVELYNGGQYQLYRYQKYTDVRLVMAAEVQAAFYGGDYDNFVFPRHDLDMAFFRVYEDGRPVKSPAYLKWSKDGAKDGELVFVSGHPGRTDRLLTVRQLEFKRDYELPERLKKFALRRIALKEYAARGPEQARRARNKLFGLENSVKANTGELAGLQDAGQLAAKKAEEEALRAAVAAKPELAFASASWDRLAAAQDKVIARFKDLQYRGAADSKLTGIAERIVRYVAELEKPNDKRYEEFRDSNLDSLRFQLFSPAPVYQDLEERMLALDLKESLDQLGAEHPYVKAALGGKDPQTRARELVSGTGLADPELRKKLAAGGRKAVAASQDPLIAWARELDPLYRELRKWREDEIESVETLEGNRLAKARFAVLGTSTYPDATFTLRLSYGKVAGYEEGTTRVPCKTTFHGLYDRAAAFDNQPPFDLSPLEAARKGDVDLAAPLNFVTTNDIIGGNSGSPVFNRDGEYVGLIFDGNIPSLVGRFAYSDERNRAVAVHSAGILEGLRKIYRMYSLADELSAP